MMFRSAFIALLTAVAFTAFSTSELQSASVNVDISFETVVSSTVTYTTAFSAMPSFAVLLATIQTLQRPNTIGYTVSYGTLGLSGTSFQVTKIVTGYGDFLGITLRWIATIGQAVQIFPIEFTMDTNGLKIYDVPFDYPTRVQWTTSTLNVAMTSIITSFTINSPDITTYRVDTTIAEWNGTGYSDPSKSLYILARLSIFGVSRPFTTVGSTNVVKIRGLGNAGTRVASTLMFVRVHFTNPTPPYAAPSVVRNTYADIAGPYSASLLNNFNTNGVSPTATRVFGIEYFTYLSYSGAGRGNLISISTTDGIVSDNIKYTDPNPGTSVLGEFYLSFASLPPAPPPTCPAGCTCDVSMNCLSCPQRGYWKASMSTDANNKNYCECLPGFYLTATNICAKCPMAANCQTCVLQAGSPVCTACSCAKYRILITGTCPCIAGYKEDTPANAYCIRGP